VVGIVGLMNAPRPATVDFKEPGHAVILLGGLGRCDDAQFGGTQYAKHVLKSLWGLPPALDMEYEKRVQAAIREIVAEGLAASSHDVGDGGLAVALLESSFGKGIGAQVVLDSGLRPEFLLFHEGPSRILVSTPQPARIQSIAVRHGVEAPRIGDTILGKVEIRNRQTPLMDCGVLEMKQLWESGLEKLLGSSSKL
ncbi:MAG: phosphoribosylformylglycinamidine synthase II, partial [Acidobacteria bacterium]|nr:phosphoribosylformylglycinamidine synthase II [Acidobacteriota bacterium]